jgi:lysophospholipase L1-like esterase
MHLETLEKRQLMSVSVDGVGARGDSYTDEYRFYAPDRSTAQNYVEQLADDRHLDFGKFSKQSRGTPRNAGFAYNWAQSADTTSDMIADGQLAGLAAQVASGKVDLAFVFIGGNDFRDVFTSSDPLSGLGTVTPQAVTNVFTAVGTLLASSPEVDVVVATVPRVSVLPEVRGAIAAGQLPQALADGVDVAIDAFNQQLRALAAASPRVALADVDGLVNSIFAPASFSVGGVTIDRNTPSNDPRSLWLADGIHAGTVGQGLLANLFVNAANEEFHTHIRPLRAREILKNAGLRNHGRHASWCHNHGSAAAAGSSRTLFSDLEVQRESSRYDVVSAAS